MTATTTIVTLHVYRPADPNADPAMINMTTYPKTVEN